MRLVCIGAADGHPQEHHAVNLGVCEIQLPAVIDPLQQALVEVVRVEVTKADEIEGHREAQLEIGMGGHPARKLHRQRHMTAHQGLQALKSEPPQDEPQLERPKSSPQRYLPVPVVDDLAARAGPVIEVLRQQAERPGQRSPRPHPKQVAVKVGQHPLVGIHRVAVGALDPVVDLPKLRTQGGDAAHGGVHVEPDAVRSTHLRDAGERIDGVGGRGPDHGVHKERSQAGLNVLTDPSIQFLGSHGELVVHLNQVKLRTAHAAPPRRRRAGLGKSASDQHSVPARCALARAVAVVVAVAVVEMVAVLEGSDPDEMRAMLDIQMEMMSGELGFDPREMLDAMEGSIVLASPAADDNAPLMQNPMEMMMGQSTSGNFMIRMRDRKVFDQILEVMAGPEMMGAMIKKDSFMEQDVWTYDPLGDMPPEFAGQGPALAPSWTMTDEWLVVSMSNADLKSMIRSSKGEGRKFMDNPEIKDVLAQVNATQGMSIGFTDLGENFATAANVLRPLLGFLPLMAGELIGDNEDLLFLFDPSNIPESDLFRKYFGWSANRISIVEDGLKAYTFSEWPDNGDSSEDSSEKKADEKAEKKEPVKF